MTAVVSGGHPVSKMTTSEAPQVITAIVGLSWSSCLNCVALAKFDASILGGIVGAPLITSVRRYQATTHQLLASTSSPLAATSWL
jgi:hypothetical protein